MGSGAAGTNQFSGWLFIARVVAIYPESRVVDVKWLTGDQLVHQAMLVSSFANFSFPAVGDYCVIIGDDSGYYCLGKIDDHYPNKLGLITDDDGNKVIPTDKEGNKLKAKRVPGGESVFMNLAKNTFLILSNSGGFSLLSGAFQHGIDYILSSGINTLKHLKVLGNTITSEASGQLMRIGAVIRNDNLGNPTTVANPVTLSGAVEGSINVTEPADPLGLDTAAVKVGDIFIEPVTVDSGTHLPTAGAATPTKGLLPHTDLGASGISRAVRALLGVFAAGTDLGTVKIDDLGNVTVNSNAAGGTSVLNAGLKIVINAPLTIIGTTPDDPSATTEPAVLGTSLITWLNTHQHGSGTGPTSTPITPALPTDFNSTKVFVK